MFRTYEYRMYPTKEQEVLLTKHFGCVRLVYNKALALRQQLYLSGENVNWVYLCKELTKWKKEEEFSFLCEVSNKALQQAIRNLESAYTSFFKSIKENNGKVQLKKNSIKKIKNNSEYRITDKDVLKFPRYKSKKDNKQSFTLPTYNRVDFQNNLIKILKFPEGIKIKVDRPFEGDIKSCTVKKSRTGKYFVTVLVDDGLEPPNKPKIEESKTIGIDLGIKHFAVISNGTIISNPNFLKQDLQRIKVLQKRASRKQNGSNNKAKINLKIAKLHEKVHNRRKDFINKLTYELTHDNQVSTICIEDLNIKGMLQNHNLAQAINDVSWYEFIRQLEYKCNWYGINLIKVDRFEPSSQRCSKCGSINKDIKNLSIREWNCPKCGAVHDRDINASINIRNVGINRNLTRLRKPNELVESFTRVKALKQEDIRRL